jgi:hypothetical protein
VEIHWDEEAVRRMVPFLTWWAWTGEGKLHPALGYIRPDEYDADEMTAYVSEYRNRGVSVVVEQFGTGVVVRKGS